MTNGRCRMHGGKAPGAAKGTSNALKHGRCTPEALGERRELMALLREVKGVVGCAPLRTGAHPSGSRVEFAHIVEPRDSRAGA